MNIEPEVYLGFVLEFLPILNSDGSYNNIIKHNRLYNVGYKNNYVILYDKQDIFCQIGFNFDTPKVDKNVCVISKEWYISIRIENEAHKCTFVSINAPRKLSFPISEDEIFNLSMVTTAPSIKEANYINQITEYLTGSNISYIEITYPPIQKYRDT